MAGFINDGTRNEMADFLRGFEHDRCVFVQRGFSQTKTDRAPRAGKQSDKLNLIPCGILFHKQATSVNVGPGHSPAHANETGTGKPKKNVCAQPDPMPFDIGRIGSPGE